MAAKESPTAATKFELPEEVASVLPSDPFEQLDVARKITSIALSTRVSALEAESASLRAAASDKDRLIADLQSQLQSLTASLDVASAHLARAESDRETLLKENASLSSAVRRLNRDVYKLEAFRKTLMQSLREDDENSEGTAQLLTTQMSLSSAPASGEDDATSPPSRSSSTSLISLSRNSFAEDYVTDAAPRPRISQELLFSSSVNDTPHFTPPGSPPKLSASVSPTKTSNPVSPRHHLTTGGMFEDRPSSYSSMPSSLHTSVSGSDTGSHTGRTRVDGKEFFRQVRSRLSYEQFGAFLANVKELNSRNQTKEETLRKADEIFGSDHKDLYAVFEKLITRNVH